LLAGLAVVAAPLTAAGQVVGFVAVGEAPPSVRRAALRCGEALAGREGFAVVESVELRRALAGEPSASPGDDPLADVRALAARADGDRLRESLGRLGERVGLDLVVTLRRVGAEIELRGFDVARGSFYRGTAMISSTAAVDADPLAAFVGPRVRAVAAAAPGADEDRPRPRRRRSRWWVWAIVGGAVAAAALVGYLAQPDPVEDTGVTLRVVAP
jgi:hypothetical protein